MSEAMMAGAGIFIGIGGIGGSIVTAVRQALEVRMRAAGDNPAAQSARDQFQFLLLDTWRDGTAAAFSSSEFVQLPGGAGQFNVDDRIEALYYRDDPSFRVWWPADANGTPLRTGNYAAGAGQLRVKGKLAYRIHLTGRDVLAVNHVIDALHRINDVLGPAQGMRTIPIYIVCSLGGGSGSGMALAFAQHLRQVLEDNSPIIGVFPLASVTSMAPSSADASSVYANTDAALREIDYVQRVAGTAENMLEPFFEWPGAGNKIIARERPFTYSYLFGRENANGLNFTAFDQYVNLIAECLIAETFSELVGEAKMDEAIAGPHSQFMQHLQARREMLGRPTTYASAAVGAVRYPAHRISTHLARSFAVRVLDRIVSTDESRARAAAKTFLEEYGIEWDGVVSLDSRFEEDIRQGTDRSEPIVNMPPIANAHWDKADAEQSARIALDAQDRLQAWMANTYVPHITQRRDEIVAEFSGPKGNLAAFVVRALEDGGAGGLKYALTAVTAIREQLELELAGSIDRVNGTPEDRGGDPGLRRDQQDALNEENWNSAVQRLRNGFGFLNRGAGAAKATFIKTTLRPAEDAWRTLVRAEAGQAVYNSMLAEATRMQHALQNLVEQTVQTRENIARVVRSDLGSDGLAGSLDVNVLDDVTLADHHFDKVLSRAIASDSESTVEAMVNSDDGVRGALLRRLGTRGSGAQLNEDYRGMLERRSVVAGQVLVEDEVDSLTIWEAIAAECDARQELDMVDRVLSDALSDMRRQRQLAEQQGLVRDDWSDVLLQSYVRGKLQECQARVRPFWRLDGIRSASHGEPYRFTVIARDKRVYEDAKNTLGLGNVLDESARMLGAGRPYELPGRHSVVLYTREGVAPLCYLDEGELKEMRDDAARTSTYKFLYTDRRFADAVDAVIAPAETPENRLMYLLGSAQHLGLLKPAGSDLGSNGHVAFDDRSWESLRDLYRAARSDGDLRRHLAQRYNEALLEFDESRRSRMVQDARLKMRERLRDAREGDDGLEIAFWEAAERAISDRIATDQFLVNG
jgi:hypothetical protein